MIPGKPAGGERGGLVESDVAVLARGPGPRAARTGAGGRYAGVGRQVITCPDRPGIVATVSEFLFEAGANITESHQYSTDPFGGELRAEFHLGGLGRRAGDHRYSADDLRRLGRHVERAVLARAVGWHLEDRVIVHQNSTIVFS
jgi:formyltetrahydrofolate hydrolase